MGTNSNQTIDEGVDPIPELKELLNDGKPVRIRNYPKQMDELSVHGYPLYKKIDYSKINTFVTPVKKFFIRNHLGYPDINFQNWRLKLTGCFENEALLSMDNLVRFPLVTRVVHIECTGNKRAEISFMANLKGLSRYANFLSFDYLLKLLDPKEWKFWINFVKRTGIRGGLLFSNGVFTGVKLFDILNEYPLRKDAKELVFEGVDKGGETIVQRTRKEDTHYARSWDIEELKKHEPILCFEMNGKPLAIEHGAPLRLVIPGIYGAEQVKWLGRIISTSEKYRGYYQESDYGYRIDGEMVPVHEMRPKAMVIKVLKKNKNILVFGVGWRGQSPIERIEVSVDGMNSWNQALLLCKGVDHSWIFWRFELPKDLKGTVTISPRAFCVNGESQPLKPGKYSSIYGNNSIFSAVVKI